jgi:glucose-1-phosphate cytidylyltransferase
LSFRISSGSHTLSAMKVVILCGGKGTRLREETEYRPKPMVPIGDRPILWHIMKIYAAHGFKEFILCLGYKGEMIKDWFRNYQWMTSDVTLSLGQKAAARFHNHHAEEDWRVTLADTGQETLTAGRIRRIRHYLGQDTEFFLTYGDCVGNIDIAAALQFHRKHGKKLTLTAVRPPGRFGELAVDDQSRVQKFNEKPQATEGRINGGFFVASTRIFDYLGDSDQMMFEQDPVLALAREGELMAWQHNGFWQPMDTFQEFTLLNKMWAAGNAPWKNW